MKIYLVGGAVRDQLLGLPVTEKDYVVVGAEPQELLDKGFVQVGKAFPVFLHPKTKEEYALARTERKSGSGYYGFVCDFKKTVTLEEDLRRRDLTINAIAQDEPTQTIIDPYHGVDDLKHKQLRHVSEAFVEDPLRLFRVARFYARFKSLGFTVAPETKTCMREIVARGELKAITGERVGQEFLKALSTKNPAAFFEVLVEVEALDDFFVEFKNGLNEQIFLQFDKACSFTQSLTYRFALLFLVLQKYHHDVSVASLVQRLRLSNDYKKIAEQTLRYFKIIIFPAQYTAEDIYHCLVKTRAVQHDAEWLQWTDMLLSIRDAFVYVLDVHNTRAFWHELLSMLKTMDFSDLKTKSVEPKHYVAEHYQSMIATCLKRF